jgi:hypothetical protein
MMLVKHDRLPRQARDKHADSCKAAGAIVAFLVQSQGLVDGERMAISGGSAGGYTTLACLAFKGETGRQNAPPCFHEIEFF